MLTNLISMEAIQKQKKAFDQVVPAPNLILDPIQQQIRLLYLLRLANANIQKNALETNIQLLVKNPYGIDIPTNSTSSNLFQITPNTENLSAEEANEKKVASPEKALEIETGSKKMYRYIVIH